ncbi:MAG: helix-turn-helix domain-containing protein [Gemmataceae bacterium]
MDRPEDIEPIASDAAPAAEDVVRARFTFQRLVRVLVLDTDANNCRHLEALLQRPEIAIYSTCDIDQMESRAELRQEALDLILLNADHCSPWIGRLDGWVQSNHPNSNIIAISCNGDESELVKLNGRLCGVLKSLDAIEMLKLVTRCLEFARLIKRSPEDLRCSIGAAIRKRRRELDLTLTQLSQKITLSIGYLSHIERGKSAASLERLYYVCQGLQWSLTELFQQIEAVL